MSELRVRILGSAFDGVSKALGGWLSHPDLVISAPHRWYVLDPLTNAKLRLIEPIAISDFQAYL